MKGKSHDLNHDLTFYAHTFNCVCYSIRSMFRVLGVYNFGYGYKGLVFCRNNGWKMENMDTGITVPKWMLIVWPKILQIPQNLSAQFLCPSPNVLDFNEKRLHWASVVREHCYHNGALAYFKVSRRVFWNLNVCCRYIYIDWKSWKIIYKMWWYKKIHRWHLHVNNDLNSLCKCIYHLQKEIETHSSLKLIECLAEKPSTRYLFFFQHLFSQKDNFNLKYR